MIQLTINYEIIKRALSESRSLIAEGKTEQAVRDSFTSHLRQIFPDTPSWVVRHIHGSEAAIKIAKETSQHTGFVDNLIDQTAIEYETDLRVPAKFRTGQLQVKDYCAGLINAGHDHELVIGILSDTVRWYAYEVRLEESHQGPHNRNSILLSELEFVDGEAAGDKEAHLVAQFLVKYLGRQGARVFTADAVAKDLGFNSQFCRTHLRSLHHTIDCAFDHNPQYGELIAQLWCSFISYLRERGRSERFDREIYIDEYYILLLGKLVCANFLEKKALYSNDNELASILDGRFFENKGLLNFVEYDYFGWLNTGEHVSEILPIAHLIQEDLVAYNFEIDPLEDVFGCLVAQLADRSQRLLLGQEWTPGWLSRKVVKHVSDKIALTERLRLIDMCCGSGSMIVEAVKVAKTRYANQRVADTTQIFDVLLQAITGFDIDPLAVMLAKINWVLTAKDVLEPLGSYQLVIPIYHADSLFAITPVANMLQLSEDNFYHLKIADYCLKLPKYLISPDLKGLFDLLVDRSYQIVSAAKERSELSFTTDQGAVQVRDTLQQLALDVNEDTLNEINGFFVDMTSIIDRLNRQGRNGIWASIFRNSFRPGLVFGQFNGLVSNPPWLAMSKIADNPYQGMLRNMAERYGIKPQGASHLHIELATIFLLHSVQHYLQPEAPVGCIVPETVLNGHHHNRFRAMNFLTSESPVSFQIDEIWAVAEHTFKNNAVVLFGKKSDSPTQQIREFAGKLVSDRGDDEVVPFYKNQQGNRTAWSRQQRAEGEGFYEPASFRQGADIMPRNLLFLETTVTSNPDYFSVKSINPVSSQVAFLVRDAKKHKNFVLSERTLPKDLFFDVITSNLLTQFHLAAPQKALLPIKRNIQETWQALSDQEILQKGAIVRNTFNEIAGVIRSGQPAVETIYNLINLRGKLVQQHVPGDGFLVFTGAGGSNVCAAYLDLSTVDPDRIILDQTVYWAWVSTWDEALYLTGLLNSQAINEVIREFQPRGAFGERHVHKLPFGVTPPFDPDQVAHQEVVEKTARLITEYRQIQAHPSILGYLNPNNGSLSSRRKHVSLNLIALTAYADYEAACKSLYGL